MINKKFRIEIVGDIDYEDLVADIYFEDQFLLMLSQEKGFENMQIEINTKQNQKLLVFKLSEFEEAINFAKNRLWELRRDIEA